MSKLYKDKSKVNGTGLFSSEDFKKNDTIAYIQGPIHVFRKFTPVVSKQMLNWIGVGKYSWINTDKSEFRFINHSCEPNTALISKRKVVAVQKIQAGEELTMDYSLTEAEPNWKIANCSCGTESCRGSILPIMKLSKKVYLKSKKIIPKNFQKIYENS